MGRADQGLNKNRQRYHVLPRTLSFVFREGEVLLLRGGPQKGSWAGRYNGVGGHIERGEDLLESARREIREETGLEVTSLTLCGIVHTDAGDPQTGILLFVLRADAEDGRVRESEEGSLHWVAVEDLKSVDLLEDLPVILPKVLSMPTQGPPFIGTYRYADDDRLEISFSH